ncbi:thiaminase/transcriptional activator TenA [Bacillus mesophilus]|uniref:Aminopyrimidine aminohydrolase n=1 Tax=Bacillus mesophilus TaxID=1808955 RepID=A0A6M0Q6W8_9BACI|nr:thiaminase II [Bacillus mesophilus]MBM7659987.1 thiaminase/transcriptional activator TenA [Bacillus mesophilus]NEY70848.1 thiaminase II [Bacillus mesophilus]
MKFTEQLRKDADAIWEASFNHPFVTGIADGSLPLECFRFYVLQDAYYLSHFSKVQALGAAKATDLHTTARFAAHAQGTYEAELQLHENFSKRMGITEAEKESFQPAPTAYAYTSHMYRAAYGHLGDILSAILPCYWLYYEIGERLKGATPSEPIYQDWIAAYGGEWFRELVEEQINRLDQLAETMSEADLKRMKEHFMISSQYELSFWEMAYTQEQWPVKKAVNV